MIYLFKVDALDGVFPYLFNFILFFLVNRVWDIGIHAV